MTIASPAWLAGPSDPWKTLARAVPRVSSPARWAPISHVDPADVFDAGLAVAAGAFQGAVAQVPIGRRRRRRPIPMLLLGALGATGALATFAWWSRRTVARAAPRVDAHDVSMSDGWAEAAGTDRPGAWPEAKEPGTNRAFGTPVPRHRARLDDPEGVAPDAPDAPEDEANEAASETPPVDAVVIRRAEVGIDEPPHG